MHRPAARVRRLRAARSYGAGPAVRAPRAAAPPPRTRRAAPRPARRAACSRGWSSGGAARPDAGTGCSPSTSASSGRSEPGRALPPRRRATRPPVRRVWASSWAMVASPAPVPGRCFSSGSSRSSRPSSRSRSTRTAVKVLVIEPMRYCTFASGACPSTELRAPVPHQPPVPHHRRDQRGRPPLGLGDGDPVQQRPPRGGKELFLRCRHGAQSTGRQGASSISWRIRASSRLPHVIAVRSAPCPRSASSGPGRRP